MNGPPMVVKLVAIYLCQMLTSTISSAGTIGKQSHRLKPGLAAGDLNYDPINPKFTGQLVFF